MNVLIVEDEQNLANEITDYLLNLGHSCITVYNKFNAIDTLLLTSFDILVLDINLPDGTGLDVLKWIKDEDRDESIIVISARDSIEDKIKGLDFGADDYITKPFHMGELTSRLNAVTRRKNSGAKEELIFNEIALNTRTREVKINSIILELTRTEFNLLRYFILNQNTVLSKRAIASHVWQDEFAGGGAYDFIYVHVKNLRKKIISEGAKDYLKTVYGVGYKFCDN